MSKPPKAVAADEIEECPRCGKPLPLCICDSVTPIANRVELLILPHPQVIDYMRKKTDNYDRWIGGMAKIQAVMRETFGKK